MNFLILKIFLTKYYSVFFVICVLGISFFIWLINAKWQKFLTNLKSKKFFYILFAFLIFFGFLARLYKINSPLADWHSFRQADTSSVTRFYLDNGINLLYPKYHDISRVQSGLFNPQGYRFVEFPIFNFIHAILTKSFPFFSLEVWGRLVSIFSAILSSYLIYFLGKRFISESAGLIALAFYLFLPYNIYFTRVILPEPLGIFFGLLSISLFVKFIEKESFLEFFLVIIFLALAVLIKPYFVFYSFPIFYLSYKKYGWEFVKQKKLLLLFFLAFLPFILWRIWMLRFPEGIPFWRWTLNGDGIRFKPSFWYWIFGERLVKLILGYFGIIPFFFGLITKGKEKGFLYSFLLGVLSYFFIFSTANVRHDYYQLISVPAIALIFSSGLVELWNFDLLNKRLARIFFIISLILMFVNGFSQTKEFYKINHPEIVEAGETVDRLTPREALIIADYNGDTAFLYQTRRRGWPVVELPIEELVKEGAKYFVSVNLDNPQTKVFMERFEILEKTDKYVILKLD